jgi:hypothetical protein
MVDATNNESGETVMANLANFRRESLAPVPGEPPAWWRPWAPYAGAVVAAALAGTAVVGLMGAPDLGPLNDISLTDTSASFNLENLPEWLFFGTHGMELYYLIGACGIAGLAAAVGIKRALRPRREELDASPRSGPQALVEHRIGDKAEDRRFHGGPIRN